MKPLAPHWFHILLALADADRHGLGIIEEIGQRTRGEMRLWPGMLYVALKRMTDEQLIVEANPPATFAAGGGRPRFYRITAAGRKVCAAEARRLASLVKDARAKRILRGSI